jgi:hypothetical protein
MSQAPCIEYKSSFVKSDLETVKLRQNYDDGTYRECKAPVFNGDGNIECLFYVEERFHHYADKLGWTTGPEMFDNFEEILQDREMGNPNTKCCSSRSNNGAIHASFSRVSFGICGPICEGLHDQTLE